MIDFLDSRDWRKRTTFFLYYVYCINLYIIYIYMYISIYYLFIYLFIYLLLSIYHHLWAFNVEFHRFFPVNPSFWDHQK